MNVGSIAPLIAVQFGAYAYIDNMYKSIFKKHPEGAGQVLVASCAGLSSAFVGCPAELVIIQ